MRLIGVLHLLGKQRAQWDAAFDNRGFYNDIAKILIDTNILIQ